MLELGRDQQQKRLAIIPELLIQLAEEVRQDKIQPTATLLETEKMGQETLLLLVLIMAMQVEELQQITAQLQVADLPAL